MMIQPCNKPLKSNPFTTYRDPQTGKWTVVKPEQNQVNNSNNSNSFSKAIKSLEKQRESHLKIVAA
jgi:hypothetical protein